MNLPLDQVQDNLPLAMGFALAAWSLENNPWAAPERVGPGYCEQSVDQLLKAP
jgi:hypothetical protein